MAVLRMHRYSVDPADLDELIKRRAALIEALRAADYKLIHTRLTRLEDGTFSDVWVWDSVETMKAVGADLPNFPQAAAALSLTRDRTDIDGEIVDER
ncbi:MAG TPA: hypothetical protein VGX25_11690 [Actinophytocola sp.]|uniref:hypothetical protein n=1 Tax=Actinophytocola sp. TaxID=1872138 RepID=UPI002DDCD671|nr:hypothetical protein [Actinophytocola sp.]HEV2780046.1 hypothetical protein [Actinophytocola sp.]